MMKRLLLSLLSGFLLAPTLAQHSHNEEFSARIHTRGGAKNSREHNTWTANIVDHNGATRYQLSKEIPFDMQYPAVHLSDSGACLVTLVFSGIVEFYDNRGNLITSVEPFGRKTTEHEQVIKCAISENRVALLCSSPESKAMVMMFDSQGSELWRAPLKGKNGGEVFISDDARFVAAGSYAVAEKVFRTTEVFDATGKVVRTFDVMFRTADIASDDRIALADRDNVLIASLRDKASPVKWSKSASNDIVTGVRFVNNFVAFSVETVNLPKGSPVYVNPSLMVLNVKGKEVARSRLRASSSTPATLTIESQRIVLRSSKSQTRVALSSLK
jgi:hypothetical protein